MPQIKRTSTTEMKIEVFLTLEDIAEALTAYLEMKDLPILPDDLDFEVSSAGDVTAIFVRKSQTSYNEIPVEFR